MPTPADAICQEVAWKNPEMRRFCCDLVRAALELLAGDSEFTTDIVPDDARKRGAMGDDVGTGIAGSAITILKSSSVIEPVGITQGGRFYPDRRASERPGAKTRYLNVYRLTSRPLAKAFLQRNGSAAAEPVQATQMELANA